MLTDDAMTYVSLDSDIPKVKKQCQGKDAIFLKDRYIAIERNCTYSSEKLSVYGRTGMSLSLHMNLAMSTEFQLSDLNPKQKEHFFRLNFQDHFKEVDPNDLTGPFGHFHLLIIFGSVAAGIIALIGAIAFYTWRHKRQIVELASLLNPEATMPETAFKWKALNLPRRQTLTTGESRGHTVPGDRDQPVYSEAIDTTVY